MQKLNSLRRHKTINEKLYIRSALVHPALKSLEEEGGDVQSPTKKSPVKKKQVVEGDWGWYLVTVLPSGSSVLKGQIISKCKLNRSVIEVPYSDINEGVDTLPSNSFRGLPSGLPPDDMVQLSHLHEPAIVDCLWKRYEASKIYTYSGTVLLAVNPFQSFSHLYTDHTMNLYWSKGLGAAIDVEPHVFAVADNAYRSMKFALETATPLDIIDQSILISGESGAGKTVSTKYVINYLCNVSLRSISVAASAFRTSTSVEQQVIQSNPILESLGNARTVRNDNSSRFGKFIEIQFTKSGNLMGANIETYLLEKGRLMNQGPSERNFHIFYEVLSGFSATDRDKFFLGKYEATDFKMTSQSGTFDRRDGVKDIDTYNLFRNAISCMEFSDDHVNSILSVVCGLLHASNLDFVEVTEDSCKLSDSNKFLGPVLKLFGVTEDTLGTSLTSYSTSMGGETIVRKLKKEKAEHALQGFVKVVYGALFTSVVRSTNAVISVKEGDSTSTMRRSSLLLGQAAIIGVLDIFGFESFKKNSFEQLCINYCNESLQQQFNKYMFLQEKEEYEREGIEWASVTFPDNQPVLDLIDKKRTGIISILDDACKVAGSSDISFANAIYRNCDSNPNFSVSKRQKNYWCFQVDHFAGPVEYETAGFVEKNKDEIPKETTIILKSSTNSFMRSLVDILSEPVVAKEGIRRSSITDRRRGPPLKKFNTIGSYFKEQLKLLRVRIDSTNPHYIRCVKPNAELLPRKYDAVSVTEQLKGAGVLEALRVSRVGFPHRFKHSQFADRYRILAAREMGKAQCVSGEGLSETFVQTISQKICEYDQIPKNKIGNDIVKSVGIHVGKTKVFLKIGAYTGLEGLRSAFMAEAVVVIQAKTRQNIMKGRYQSIQLANLKLQCLARRMLAVKVVDDVRMKCANKAALRLQCWVRVMLAVKLVERIKKDEAALIIQTVWREHRSVWNKFIDTMVDDSGAEGFEVIPDNAERKRRKRFNIASWLRKLRGNKSTGGQKKSKSAFRRISKLIVAGPMRLGSTVRKAPRLTTMPSVVE